MTEDIANADGGKRRRLPLWMAMPNSGARTRNKSEGAATCLLSEEKAGMQDTVSELKSITKHHKTKPANAIDYLCESKTVERCSTAKRKRKQCRRDVGKDSLTNLAKAKTNTDDAEGDPTKVDNGAAARTKSRKSKRLKIDQVTCSPVFRDEVELTVEDLVRIAEEYVNADRQKQLQSDENRSNLHPSSSSVYSSSKQALSKCTTMSTSHSSASHPCEEKNPQPEINASTSESGAAPQDTSTSESGAAPQDMLDLLLGPLLKKPVSHEHDKLTITTENPYLTHKSNRSSTTSTEIWKEEVLQPKRKSSLKDKVAMLLD